MAVVACCAAVPVHARHLPGSPLSFQLAAASFHHPLIYLPPTLPYLNLAPHPRPKESGQHLAFFADPTQVRSSIYLSLSGIAE